MDQSGTPVSSSQIGGRMVNSKSVGRMHNYTANMSSMQRRNVATKTHTPIEALRDRIKKKNDHIMNITTKQHK